MVDISIETWNKTEVSVINIHENDNINKTLLKLICISDIAKRWDGKNIYDLIDKEIKRKYKVISMSDLTKQQIKKYKIDRSRLIKGSKHSMYVHEDIAITIIMQSRLSDLEIIKFRSDLGFNQINLILKKEQTVLKSIKDAFEGEDMQTQYIVIGYKIDSYFHKHKLAIEVDELGHAVGNINNKIERQRTLQKELNCAFIRINPDEKDFNIFKEINKIYRHITRSKKKQKKQKNKK